jgi:hypothetical protein
MAMHHRYGGNGTERAWILPEMVHREKVGMSVGVPGSRFHVGGKKFDSQKLG